MTIHTKEGRQLHFACIIPSPKPVLLNTKGNSPARKSPLCWERRMGKWQASPAFTAQRHIKTAQNKEEKQELPIAAIYRKERATQVHSDLLYGQTLLSPPKKDQPKSQHSCRESPADFTSFSPHLLAFVNASYLCSTLLLPHHLWRQGITPAASPGLWGCRNPRLQAFYYFF